MDNKYNMGKNIYFCYQFKFTIFIVTSWYAFDVLLEQLCIIEYWNKDKVV